MLGIYFIPKGTNACVSFFAVDAPVLDSRRHDPRDNASEWAYSFDTSESLMVGDNRDAASVWMLLFLVVLLLYEMNIRRSERNSRWQESSGAGGKI